MRRRTFLGTLAASGAAAPDTYAIYVVPHTHIDIEWYWTYDKTRVLAGGPGATTSPSRSKPRP